VAAGTPVYFEITTPATGTGVIEPSAETDATGLATVNLSYADDQVGLTLTVQVTAGGVSQTLLVTLP